MWTAVEVLQQTCYQTAHHPPTGPLTLTRLVLGELAYRTLLNAVPLVTPLSLTEWQPLA